MKLDPGGYAGFEDLPASFVWSILEEGNTSIGQVWINEQNSPNGEKRLFINFAVYAEWRSKGAARATLPLVENELRKKGVRSVFAQVNSNKVETGRRVRGWLKAEGYQLLREDIFGRYANMDDETIIENNPHLLKFMKVLVP